MQVPHEIMAKYIERRKIDLEACLDSFDRHHYAEIEKIGHQLKGNGTTFGYPELSHLGKKLEEAAKLEDGDALGASLEEFSRLIATLH